VSGAYFPTIGRRGPVLLLDSVPWEAVSRPRETLRPEHYQPFAVQIEIHQSEIRAQPVMVLRDASVPHLVEAEHTIQDVDRMLYLGPYTRLTAYSGEVVR
jgi:hypothetical protein